MKTTPEGLTHLINMLLDVANLQRKARGTPGACCEVELRLDEEESRVSVHVYTEVYLTAQPPATLSADNNRDSGRTATPADAIRTPEMVTPADFEIMDELGLRTRGV
jgi:hypothetical protein